MKVFLIKSVISLAMAVFFVASGCSSPDVDLMEEGLIKSGIPADQAECFAKKMSKTVDSDPYNYMAALMNKGVDEKTAVNRTRRKYTADFKTPMKEARNACVK